MAFNESDMSFGAYTSKWNGNELGLIEGVIRQQLTAHAQDVRASRHGDTVLDGVYRGGNMFVTIQIKEWNDATKAIMWPFSDNLGLSGVEGRSMWDLAKPLVLTVVPLTQAAKKGPKTRTYDKAIFSPEHNKEVIFGNEERNVPILLRIYPVLVSSTGVDKRWFRDVNP